MKPLVASNHPDWPGLPWHVLSSIMGRLNIDDCIRSGAVCTNWHSIFCEEVSSKKPSPFLLVAPPPPEPNHHHRALYSLSHNKLCTSRLQVPRHKACRGSSFGWLVTLETKARYQCQIQLLNPFQNRIIDLPPPDNIVQQQPEYQGRWTGPYLQKAVLSSDPCSSPTDFVVMAIMSSYRGLAFFKPGHTTWTMIGDNWHVDMLRHREVYDVIFSHNTNQFYVLYISGELAVIDLLELEGPNPKLTLIAPRPEGIHFPSYLVEDLSSGELLVVYKKALKIPSRANVEPLAPPLEINIHSEDTFEAVVNKDFALPFDASTSSKDTSEDHDVTVQFDVFKFDTLRGSWIRVDNLGENVMFLGNNASFLRPSSDCPGCESNCIYYTADEDAAWFGRNYNSYGLPDDGVYNLGDGTVRPHYSSERFADIDITQGRPWDPLEKVIPSPMKYLPPPIWVEPTLKRFS